MKICYLNISGISEFIAVTEAKKEKTEEKFFLLNFGSSTAMLSQKQKCINILEK